MREWMTPRCLLVGIMLIAAPGAALAHLLATWVPSTLTIARLDREVETTTRELDIRWEQYITLRKQTVDLRKTLKQRAAEPAWLPARDRHSVFDKLAAALTGDGVTIEQLTLGDPEPYAATSRSNLLACEQVTVRCTGSYEQLTAGLERVDELALPSRFVEMSWNRANDRLELFVRIEVPFAPDESLREVLADEVIVEDEDET